MNTIQFPKTKSGIDIKRRDYKERTNRFGKVIPASYECRYIYAGKEIAWYESKKDILYLRTRYIGRDFKKNPYDRAMRCELKEVYKDLFSILNVSPASKVSEYTEA